MWIILAVSGYLLTWMLIPWILLKRTIHPSAAIAWILTIVFLPYLGALLSLVFGMNRIERHKPKKHAATLWIDRISPASRGQREPSDGFSDFQRRLAQLAGRLAATHPTTGNDIQLLANTKDAFARLEQEIQSARKTLHVEFYIWRADKIGTRIRDLLIQKAREGLEVRFLYDGIGSIGLGRKFLRPMAAAGIQVAPFLPGRTFRERWSINLRNHRKLVVIDGQIAFTGGMNVGDEYLGRNPSFGRWRDTQLVIRGPAVLQSQQVFAEDWYYATGQELLAESYYPEPEDAGHLVAQVIAGGPHTDVAVFQSLLFAAISRAKHRVSLATSYFVPPPALAMAMETAARQGVRVRLLTARKATYLWTLLAGRSFFQSLLAAGVEIYEYQDGFFHAKTITVDGQWSLVGTPNFDMRSLTLNFEVALAMYDRQIAADLERQFDGDLCRATRVDPARWAQRSVWNVFGERLCWLFAPVL